MSSKTSEVRIYDEHWFRTVSADRKELAQRFSRETVAPQAAHYDKTMVVVVQSVNGLLLPSGISLACSERGTLSRSYEHPYT